MNNKVTVIMENGKELIYENAKLTKNRKIVIYQVNDMGQIGDVLAELDPTRVDSFYTE